MLLFCQFNQQVDDEHVVIGPAVHLQPVLCSCSQLLCRSPITHSLFHHHNDCNMFDDHCIQYSDYVVTVMLGPLCLPSTQRTRYFLNTSPCLPSIPKNSPQYSHSPTLGNLSKFGEYLGALAGDLMGSSWGQLGSLLQHTV